MHATEFVDSYFDAWNQGDPKGVADHLAADGIHRDIPENSQRTHDQLITSLVEFFSRDRLRYELIGEILASENTIAFQYKMSPLNNVAESDSKQVYNGAEFMTLNGDAAITITDYYDVPGKGRPANLARTASRDARQRKYAKSGLSSGQMHLYKMRLDPVMHMEKAYLQSDLTLPKLAEAVDCSVNHLSQVINAGLGLSFFDYLNQFRIEHARQLLTTHDDYGNAIINIAFTVGFNSNSAFYAAFKKWVGQTPAQYRRAHLERRLSGSA